MLHNSKKGTTGCQEIIGGRFSHPSVQAEAQHDGYGKAVRVEVDEKIKVGFI